MSSLIVDFPQQQRQRRRRTLGVRFASQVEVTFYQQHPTATATTTTTSDDIIEVNENDLYYNKGDLKLFKAQHKQTIREMHKLYHHHKMEAFADENAVMMITGIENYLTPALVRKTLTRRAACVQAVLSEQDLLQCHRYYDDYDADNNKLAAASMKYSEVAGQRSHRIGVMQSSSR